MSTSVLALLIGTSRHLLFCALHRYHKEDISRKSLESSHAVDVDGIKSVRSLTNLEVPGTSIKVDRVELSETMQTRKNLADASRSFGRRTLTRGSSVSATHGVTLTAHSKKKTPAELSRSQSCAQTLSNPESTFEE